MAHHSLNAPTRLPGNGYANGPNSRNGWVFTTLLTILLAISGAILTHFNNRVRDLEVVSQHNRERITTVEAHLQDMHTRLQHIEDKLDKALDRNRRTTP